MNDYTVTTDSGCDISPATLTTWGVKLLELTYTDISSDEIFYNHEVALSDFYENMRQGTIYKTSAVNPEECKEAFKKELKAGRDIIHIALSSGLSTSMNSARIAAEELSDDFPARRITVIDSLCGSAGQGLLVYLAVKKRNAGCDYDSLAKYLCETVPQISHWVTVDNLKYLKRGGRINSAEAFAATVLDIKPIIHVDGAGQLVSISKVRGRKQAVKTLYEKFKLLAVEPENSEYFISHADCYEDALLLEDYIFQMYGTKAVCIANIGPVIGSHAGPGTLALFFIGKER